LAVRNTLVFSVELSNESTRIAEVACLDLFLANSENLQEG
jgi:hypothetical protein